MFTVLEIKPFVPQPFFRRIFAKPPQPTVEKVAVRGGAFFYKVTVSTDKTGALDVSFLPYAVGAAAQRILFCGACELPLPAPLQLFAPRIFPTVLFINTACAFLQTHRPQFSNAVIGIFDPNAQLQTAVNRFVPYAKTIRIYCEDPSQYETVQAEVLSSVGLSIVVSNTPTALNGCDIVLSPYLQTGDGKIGTLTVFRGGKTVFAGEGITLPPEYEARCFTGTDKISFASALYECCNTLDLHDLQYTKFVPVKSP